MEVKRSVLKACCGRSFILLRIDRFVTKDFITSFKTLGFKETEHFTKAGILYMENSELIITCPFGSDKIQIKCKKDNCNGLDSVEEFIKSM